MLCGQGQRSDWPDSAEISLILSKIPRNKQQRAVWNQDVPHFLHQIGFEETPPDAVLDIGAVGSNPFVSYSLIDQGSTPGNQSRFVLHLAKRRKAKQNSDPMILL